MNCGYCKDCKHWYPDNKPIKNGYGFCLDIGEAYDGKPIVDGLLAYVMNYEEISPCLVTFNDFGCVRFEDK